MEVSQLSRTLARSLGLNEDLCETLSLCHDLGHTPFGHAGEETLNECMNKFGGFDHNLQTIRIVTLLDNKYYDFLGLNLTIETLDGLVKHNGPVENLTKYKSIFKKDFLTKKINFTKFPSLEAQISAISDDIAYNNHDLEDGLRANLFTINKLRKISFLKKIIDKHIKYIKTFRREVIINQIVRESINLMMLDVIKETKKNLKKFKLISITDVYNNKRLVVNFSKNMQKVDKEIKFFLKNNMYNNKKVLKNTNRGKKIIKKLFTYLSNNHKKYINKFKLENDNKERAISDFIAGMTDRFAINLYNRIK